MGYPLPLEHLAKTGRPLELTHELFKAVLHETVQCLPRQSNPFPDKLRPIQPHATQARALPHPRRLCLQRQTFHAFE